MSYSIILLSQFSCSAGRQSQLEYHARVNAGMFMRDSVTINQLLRQVKNKLAVIRHIEFIPPDSVKQQYVKSVTSVITREENEEERSSLSQATTASRFSNQVKTETYQTSNIQMKTKSWLSGTIVFLVLTGFCYLLYRLIS